MLSVTEFGLLIFCVFIVLNITFTTHLFVASSISRNSIAEKKSKFKLKKYKTSSVIN